MITVEQLKKILFAAFAVVMTAVVVYELWQHWSPAPDVEASQIAIQARQEHIRDSVLVDSLVKANTYLISKQYTDSVLHERFHYFDTLSRPELRRYIATHLDSLAARFH